MCGACWERRVYMNIQYLVSELEAERNRLDRAISILEGLTSSARRLGTPPKKASAGEDDAR